MGQRTIGIHLAICGDHVARTLDDQRAPQPMPPTPTFSALPQCLWHPADPVYVPAPNSMRCSAWKGGHGDQPSLARFDPLGLSGHRSRASRPAHQSLPRNPARFVRPRRRHQTRRTTLLWFIAKDANGRNAHTGPFAEMLVGDLTLAAVKESACTAPLSTLVLCSCRLPSKSIVGAPARNSAHSLRPRDRYRSTGAGPDYVVGNSAITRMPAARNGTSK